MSNETAQKTATSHDVAITVTEQQQRKIQAVINLAAKNDKAMGTLNEAATFIFRKGLDYVAGAEIRLYQMKADKELRIETERLLRLLLNKHMDQQQFSAAVSAATDRLSVAKYVAELA